VAPPARAFAAFFNDGSPHSEVFAGGVVAYFAAALWLGSRS